MVQMRPLSVYDMVIIIFSEKLPSLPWPNKTRRYSFNAPWKWNFLLMRSIWVSGQFDTTNFATSESQIAKGGDLTFSLWVACRMKLILNES